VRGRFTMYVQGVGFLLLTGLGVTFAVYAWLREEPTEGFLTMALLSGALGGVLLWLGRAKADPGRRESLIGVLLLWLSLPLMGGVPFAMTANMPVLDAIFESMSGFTTTGATMLVSFAEVPSSLLMWRALTQWLGGVGIVVIFIAVFPPFGVAGRQLFFAEVPGPTEERLTPRLRNTAGAVLLVYIVLTLLCSLSYAVAGMRRYDALLHGFTTIASGGFSSHPLSFEGFSPAQNWVAALFMVFAGANFALQYQLVIGRPAVLLRDRELQAYLAIVGAGGVLLTLTLLELYAPLEALRHGVFQSLTMVTTTGYASADFARWPLPAQATLVLLMFVGGSAGSAAGGIKVIRWLILVKATAVELRRTLHPRVVKPVMVGRRVVGEEVIRSVAAFITLYLLLFAVTTWTVTVLGEDFTTAFTAAVACIGNIGPGLGAVGPMANFAELHPVSKALLTFGMYAGRLEVVTVFVLLNRDFWYLPRRKGARP
jgi:trk system potassium uptake protein TrkH